MSWIRWAGILLFLVLVGLFVAAYWLLADWLVERGVESTGTELNQAKVELASADVSLANARLSLKHLQVADKTAPMKNLLQFGELNFDVDTSAAIRRQFHVEQLQLTDLMFDQPRKTSGAVSDTVLQKSRRALQLNMPEIGFEPPKVEDVKAILEKEQLQTLQRAEALQTSLSEKQSAWQQRIDDLPDDTKVDEYKARIEAIKMKGGDNKLLQVLGQGKELNEVLAQIKTDIAALKEAKQALSEDSGTLKQQVAALKQAPAEDIQRLKDKYGLSPQGVANIAATLFGGQVAQWVQRAADLYARYGHYLQHLDFTAAENSDEPAPPARSEGVDVLFVEQDPAPVFWLKNGELSGAFALQNWQGKLSGKIRHISSAPALVPQPMEIMLQAADDKNTERFALNGSFDHRIDTQIKDQVQLKINDLVATDWTLADHDQASLNLRTGKVTINGNAQRVNHRLDITVDVRITDANFDFNSSESNEVVEALKASISQMKAVDLQLNVGGTLESPTIQVTSSATDVLSQAIKARFKQETQKLEARLTEEITARTGGPIAEVEAKLTGLSDLQSLLDNRLEDLQQLLSKR